MRKVGIRKFHKNMWEEVKDLPVLVTKHSEPLFIVTDDSKPETKKTPVKIISATPTGVQRKCAWEKVIGGRRFTCNKITSGEYCDDHR